ncbi:MAG: hypothetical protein AAB588_02130 [Patescibacteria group bacterium]
MDISILSLSDRGQLTIPQQIRNQIQQKHFICVIEDGKIVLKPLQTREEFLAELDNAADDWEKNGGLTLSKMKKKYRLK